MTPTPGSLNATHNSLPPQHPPDPLNHVLLLTFLAHLFTDYIIIIGKYFSCFWIAARVLVLPVMTSNINLSPCMDKEE